MNDQAMTWQCPECSGRGDNGGHLMTCSQPWYPFAKEPPPFKVGDVVRLKSGGPKMTVEEETNAVGDVYVAWFDGAELKREPFDVRVLVLAAASEQLLVGKCRLPERHQAMNHAVQHLREKGWVTIHPDDSIEVVTADHKQVELDRESANIPSAWDTEWVPRDDGKYQTRDGRLIADKMPTPERVSAESPLRGTYPEFAELQRIRNAALSKYAPHGLPPDLIGEPSEGKAGPVVMPPVE